MYIRCNSAEVYVTINPVKLLYRIDCFHLLNSKQLRDNSTLVIIMIAKIYNY